MKPLVLIVTGLSGSGKTIALRALEDSGFSCSDNLPPQIVAKYVETVTADGRRERVAVGMDVREHESLPEIGTVLDELAEACDLRIIFLEASLDVLIRRFKETRRPHPLQKEGAEGLESAISLEKGMLDVLRDRADRIIDTSPLTPHQLRNYVSEVYGSGHAGSGMSVDVVSFGFKHGHPQGMDLVFDVRFLPIPHFIPELKGLTGSDRQVKDFVMEKDVTREFMKRLGGFLEWLIPHYMDEGKAYLTIGIGCTGGQHRSVAIAERLAETLNEQIQNVRVQHRDVEC